MDAAGHIAVELIPLVRAQAVRMPIQCIATLLLESYRLIYNSEVSCIWTLYGEQKR